MRAPSTLGTKPCKEFGLETKEGEEKKARRWAMQECRGVKASCKIL